MLDDSLGNEARDMRHTGLFPSRIRPRRIIGDLVATAAFGGQFSPDTARSFTALFELDRFCLALDHDAGGWKTAG